MSDFFLWPRIAYHIFFPRCAAEHFSLIAYVPHRICQQAIELTRIKHSGANKEHPPQSILENPACGRAQQLLSANPPCNKSRHLHVVVRRSYSQLHAWPITSCLPLSIAVVLLFCFVQPIAMMERARCRTRKKYRILFIFQAIRSDKSAVVLALTRILFPLARAACAIRQTLWKLFSP